MVIRYTLSNCQTSTGTRHQAPTSLANPPDVAARSHWLLPLRRADSDPVNLRMNQICAFPLAVSETHDRGSADAPWLRCSQRRIQLSSFQRKTTPFITSFSLFLSWLPPFFHPPSVCSAPVRVCLCPPLKVPKTLRILRSESPWTAEVGPIGGGGAYSDKILSTFLFFN